MNHDEIISSAREKIRTTQQSSVIEEVFTKNIEQLLLGSDGTIRSSAIAPVGTLPHVDSLSKYSEHGRAELPHALVLKLNGGLGTGMGLDKAKSLIPVKDGHTFLDIIVKQNSALRLQHGVEVPLLFMNSFRTEDDTLQAIPKDLNASSGLSPSLLQHQVPKLNSDTYLPVEWPTNSELEWCPPGHGDLYAVLYGTKILEQALSKGYKYLFISNADNLGATLSENILGYMSKNNVPFLMEVADRTAVDRKGGHLARRSNGDLLLREKAQVPSDDEEDFQDYKKYNYFNTNSLWVNLEVLNSKLEESSGYLPLPIIKNKKHVDPTDATSQQVIQLETAMGAAIEVFKGAEAVAVSRKRFLPVKTTEDLFRIQSDLFHLNENGLLEGSSEALSFPIELDQSYYKTISMYNSRFPYGPPSLKECSRISIRGDVSFGKSISCKGAILLESGDAMTIEDGTTLTEEE